jgi:hypothetical protein
VVKVKLPEPITRLQLVHWPSHAQLAAYVLARGKSPMATEEKLYLEGLESRWLWNDEFDLEESKAVIDRRARVLEAVVQVAGRLEVWPLEWTVEGEDAVWWKGGLLTIVREATHLRLLYPPKDLLRD